LRCAFPLVLAVFAHIAATISHVAANVAPTGTNIFRVRSNLATIGSQFSAFPAIDPPLTGRCAGTQSKQRRQQQHPSQKCSLHTSFSSSLVNGFCAKQQRRSGSPNAEERKHFTFNAQSCALKPGSVLFGEPLAKNLDAELVGVDEIFHSSFAFQVEVQPMQNHERDDRMLALDVLRPLEYSVFIVDRSIRSLPLAVLH
jgi:hypothetical protein